MKKREIIGSDIKAYLNDERFKINEKNKPRIFANTVKMTRKNFDKSIFTLCDLERMINVLHGQFRQLKCFMNKKKDNLL